MGCVGAAKPVGGSSARSEVNGTRRHGRACRRTKRRPISVLVVSSPMVTLLHQQLHTGDAWGGVWPPQQVCDNSRVGGNRIRREYLE